jgi:hypothetical protein
MDLGGGKDNEPGDVELGGGAGAKELVVASVWRT